MSVSLAIYEASKHMYRSISGSVHEFQDINVSESLPNVRKHGVDFVAGVSGAELTEASCCTQTDSHSK
jgi:hypothetical protein